MAGADDSAGLLAGSALFGREDVDEVLGGDGRGGGEEVVGQGEVEEGDGAEERLGGEDGHRVKGFFFWLFASWV